MMSCWRLQMICITWESRPSGVSWEVTRLHPVPGVWLLGSLTSATALHISTGWFCRYWTHSIGRLARKRKTRVLQSFVQIWRSMSNTSLFFLSISCLVFLLGRGGIWPCGSTWAWEFASRSRLRSFPLEVGESSWPLIYPCSGKFARGLFSSIETPYLYYCFYSIASLPWFSVVRDEIKSQHTG